jgi:hypothetical protein
MDELKPGLIYYTGNPIATIKGEMTLRDYFAAKAMQACFVDDTNVHGTARLAYRIADAMLEARRGDDAEPLYTAPPKREWVGLDDDIPGLGLVTEEFYNGMIFAEDILREKNT